jgi:hypothetical protein
MGFDTVNLHLPTPIKVANGSGKMMCRRQGHHYANRLGGSNGDDAWRGMVTIVELIDPRPYKIDLHLCGRSTLYFV